MLLFLKDIYSPVWSFLSVITKSSAHNRICNFIINIKGKKFADYEQKPEIPDTETE